MGNFEKLSVLVIVVIIVMILVVALYTWTDNPAETGTTTASHDTSTGSGTTAEEQPENRAGGGGWTKEPDPPQEPKPAVEEEPKPETPVTPAPETVVESKTWIYVIKAGDSLGGIAQKELGAFKRWTEIEALNPGIDSSTLRKGMQITMPPREIAAVTPPPTTPDKTPGTTIITPTTKESPRPGGKYVVRARDTLETIAQRAYGTKSRWPEIYVKNLGRMNNANDLREGMTLFIPE